MKDSFKKNEMVKFVNRTEKNINGIICNQYYVVLESNELENYPIRIRRLGEKMVLWRDLTGKVKP
jgi:phenylpropionate dioxygenase-like ring-hydroxylating dioxygenase large terminal subunit